MVELRGVEGFWVCGDVRGCLFFFYDNVNYKIFLCREI